MYERNDCIKKLSSSSGVCCAVSAMPASPDSFLKSKPTSPALICSWNLAGFVGQLAVPHGPGSGSVCPQPTRACQGSYGRCEQPGRGKNQRDGTMWRPRASLHQLLIGEGMTRLPFPPPVPQTRIPVWEEPQSQRPGFFVAWEAQELYFFFFASNPMFFLIFCVTCLRSVKQSIDTTSSWLGTKAKTWWHFLFTFVIHRPRFSLFELKTVSLIFPSEL